MGFNSGFKGLNWSNRKGLYDRSIQATHTGGQRATCDPLKFFWRLTKLFKANCEYGPKITIYVHTRSTG